jgi:hypothetical protein
VPEALVSILRATIQSKWAFLLALNLFLLVVGCLMDIFSAIVVVVPLILPLAVEFGVHPIHLAIIFLLNLEVGYSTPPVGMNLFIASFFFRQPIIRLYKVAMPYLVLALVALAAVTYIEPLSTFTVPKRGATIEGGMGGPSPSRRAPAKNESGKSAAPSAAPGPATAPATGKPGMDGICDPKLKGDPDCEDIEVDEEEGASEKKPEGDKGAAKVPPGTGSAGK